MISLTVPNEIRMIPSAINTRSLLLTMTLKIVIRELPRGAFVPPCVLFLIEQLADQEEQSSNKKINQCVDKQCLCVDFV